MLACVAFVVGVFVGSVFGFWAAALCRASKDADAVLEAHDVGPRL